MGRQIAGRHRVLLVMPAVCFAQASITGLVKDSSGAVRRRHRQKRPVPHSSKGPVGGDRRNWSMHRIADLRPGTYAVTFSLTGFSTVRREGVELAGTFVATINTDLTVGSLAETVVVQGESPTIDIQSAKRQEVISSEVATAIPTGRSYNSLMVLIPGVAVTSADVATGPCGACTFGLHGQTGEGRVFLDGIPQEPRSPGHVCSKTAQVSITTTGGLGESETSGPVMNFVPRPAAAGERSIAGNSTLLGCSSQYRKLKDAGLILPAPCQC